jgi:hypothetical protein
MPSPFKENTMPAQELLAASLIGVLGKGTVSHVTASQL